ncbi:MAG: hypothetical protein ABGX16_17760 [Pirellulales bacterium]
MSTTVCLAEILFNEESTDRRIYKFAIMLEFNRGKSIHPQKYYILLRTYPMTTNKLAAGYGIGSEKFPQGKTGGFGKNFL